MDDAEKIAAVREVLQQFQEGYRRRELDELDNFMNLFVRDAALEVIGASAVEKGAGEWCLGRDMVRELVKSDWRYWGDLALDVAEARIHIRSDVAWLATEGTVAEALPPEDVYEGFLDYAQVLLEEDVDPAAALIELLREGANTLYEAQKGETYIWPLRFSAVLVQDAERWRFHHVQFSFPTTHFPDVRRARGNGRVR